jgi:hypothetical protein
VSCLCFVVVIVVVDGSSQNAMMKWVVEKHQFFTGKQAFKTSLQKNIVIVYREYVGLSSSTYNAIRFSQS